MKWISNTGRIPWRKSEKSWKREQICAFGESVRIFFRGFGPTWRGVIFSHFTAGGIGWVLPIIVVADISFAGGIGGAFIFRVNLCSGIVCRVIAIVDTFRGAELSVLIQDYLCMAIQTGLPVKSKRSTRRVCAISKKILCTLASSVLLSSSLNFWILFPEADCQHLSTMMTWYWAHCVAMANVLMVKTISPSTVGDEFS